MGNKKLLLSLNIAAAAAKSLQLCLTLRHSMNCSLPGSSVHGIFQARVLEWVAIAFSEKNFVNTEINGHPKVQYLVNMTDESELPSQATTVFTW